MTGTANNITSAKGKASFKLRIKNPCIDSNFVQIHPADLHLKQNSYTLFSNSATSPYSILTHTDWEISTNPIAHTLCGTISYKATFEGSSIGKIT